MPAHHARAFHLCAGGSTFAEDPDLAVPEARIIWHADLDPGTLRISAEPADPADPDSVDVDRLAPWLTTATGCDGFEHIVLSNGWQRIRIDLDSGSLAQGGAFLLRYRVSGVTSAESKLLSLRQFLGLCRHGQFASSLFPPERRVDRWLKLLRVHDALQAGASQREIGTVLFGQDLTRSGWYQDNDWVRSRVRRLVRDARTMMRGGYRLLLHRRHRP